MKKNSIMQSIQLFTIDNFFLSIDGEKNWLSTPILGRTIESNGINSTNSTPSTISPSQDSSFNDESKLILLNDCDKKDEYKNHKDVLQR